MCSFLSFFGQVSGGVELRSFQLVSPSSPKHRIQLPLWQTVPWMLWWAAARTPSWNKPPMVAMILRLGFGPAVHQDLRGWWQGWIKFQSLKPACWKHLRPIYTYTYIQLYTHEIYFETIDWFIYIYILCRYTHIYIHTYCIKFQVLPFVVRLRSRWKSANQSLSADSVL